MEPFASFYWRDTELAGLQFTSNRFAARDVRVHRHVGFTLSVADTELQVRTPGGVTRVPPGTLTRIAPRVWHSLRAASAPWREQATYCSLALAQSLKPVQPGCAQASTSSPPGAEPDEATVSFFDREQACEFLEIHRLLREAEQGGRPETAFAARVLLRERLTHWLPTPASEMATSSAAAIPVKTLDDERLQRLYALIAATFQQRLTLESLADSVGWHPVHLLRRFKTAWGFTPHELLVGHRIEYARDLIAGGALVTVAAHAAGFSDQSHLHKTFLSTYAVVPGEYRRLSRLDALQPPSARNGRTE